MVGYDPVTGLYKYLLPNGTIFFLDSEGKVIRIEEGGTVAAVGDYKFNYENGKLVSLTLKEGVTIVLTDGTLTVEQDVFFEVLSEAVSAKWLVTNGLFNNESGIVIRTTKINGKDREEIDFKISSIGTWSGYEWWCLDGLVPGTKKGTVLDAEEDCFLIAYSEKNNIVRKSPSEIFPTHILHLSPTGV